ncbi:MAG: alpha-1,4-glucan--maltose-1-phosphate maltosyltransferase, partial [Pseudonocardiales bacterium]
SEKYQLRPRDFDAAEREGRSLAPYLTTLNQIRRRHPALHRLRNLRFHAADNDAITAFSKRDDDSGDTVLVVCTLDPHNVRESITTLDLAELGISTPEWFTVHDELGGESYQWGRSNYVRLDPHVEPAHVFRVEGQDW